MKIQLTAALLAVMTLYVTKATNFPIIPGYEVRINKLKKDSVHNGKVGIVREFNPDRERWEVLFGGPSGELLAVKEEHLTPMTNIPVPGARVRLKKKLEQDSYRVGALFEIVAQERRQG